eukprot:76903_1
MATYVNVNNNLFWQCDRCTYHNQTEDQLCEMCGNKRSKHEQKNNDEYDEFEDVAEILVTGGDKRDPIYDTREKQSAIISCIGQIKTYYPNVGGGYTIGTGTLVHVIGDRCFVLTCAHNIRTNVYQCQTSTCNRKMLSNNSRCDRCGGKQFKREKRLHKADRVVFVRRSIDQASFGKHEDDYECEMDHIYINDYAYENWPHPKSGQDIAILLIDDKKAAQYYKNKCQNIVLVNKPELFDNAKIQMHLFGYPGDKNNGTEMWGMSTPTENSLQIKKKKKKIGIAHGL